VALASSVAALIYLVLAALAIVVVSWCLIDFPSFRLVLGVPVLLAVGLVWPRFAPLPKYTTALTRTEAPALFAMLDDVVAATGARPPHIVAAAEGFDADGTHVGLRQRRALVLGVPFWLSLTAAQQVAVLAHLLGHFIDGDPRRRFLVGPVESTLTRTMEMLRPARSRMLDPISDPKIIAGVLGTRQISVSQYQLLVAFSEVVWAPIARVLIAIVGLVRLGLVGAAQPVSHHAAYSDDALAARIAGTEAITSVLELLRRETAMITRIQAAARSGGTPAAWPQIAAEVGANPAALPPPDARPRRSRFDHHPPLDERLRMLAGQPAEPGTTTVTDDTATRVAAELDRLAKRIQRDLILT
jgi:hypothetical protein